MSALPRDLVIVGEEPVVLVELDVVEQRYRAVLEVLDGASVVGVAQRNGVTRQTVHEWLRVDPVAAQPTRRARAAHDRDLNNHVGQEPVSERPAGAGD